METAKLAELLAMPQLADYRNRLEKMLDRAVASDSLGINVLAKRILKNGGKRLRPTLVMATGSLKKSAHEKNVLMAAAAVELVHQASLVHDDIIDNHQQRRNLPTIFSQEGPYMALLVGDYLIAKGLMLAGSVSDEVGRVLAEAVAKMCQGQAEELSQKNVILFNQKYIRVAEQKTAALIKAACIMGGLCVELSNPAIDALGSYGRNFGVSFQIIDDLLDDDFKYSEKVVKTLGRYLRSTANALDKLPDTPATQGLKRLPGYYAKQALPQTILKLL